MQLVSDKELNEASIRLAAGPEAGQGAARPPLAPSPARTQPGEKRAGGQPFLSGKPRSQPIEWPLLQKSSINQVPVTSRDPEKLATSVHPSSTACGKSHGLPQIPVNP